MENEGVAISRKEWRLATYRLCDLLEPYKSKGFCWYEIGDIKTYMGLGATRVK